MSVVRTACMVIEKDGAKWGATIEIADTADNQNGYRFAEHRLRQQLAEAVGWDLAASGVVTFHPPVQE